MDQLRFTIPEILSLLGVAQCVYVLVYMAFRSGHISRATLPILYFLCLATAFFADFAGSSIGDLTRYYFYWHWAAWFLGPPLSVLLVIQIAQIHTVPALRHYWVLALIPAAFLMSVLFTQGAQFCTGLYPCAERRDLLITTGLVAGALSLLAIWSHRGLIEALYSQKEGKTRYWLILSVAVVNALFLLDMLLRLHEVITPAQAVLIRTFLGLGLVYLVGTALFRIYPQAVKLSTGRSGDDSLSAEEKKLAARVETLLKLDKVYHEATYSRADLARECGASEAVISRIINIHFNKSFPQLINEHRVEDAKQLLRETDATVKTVASEVGFNSLPSFNRVFKEMSGHSPSEYRKLNKS